MRRPHLIVPVQESLLAFKRALDQPELPCIDFEAVLGIVVDSMSSRKEAPEELLHLGKTLLRDEYLGSRTGSVFSTDEEVSFYESPEDNILGLEHIVDLAKNLGQQLKQQFEAYRIYTGDDLGYEYHGIIDEHAIILRPTAETRR